MEPLHDKRFTLLQAILRHSRSIFWVQELMLPFGNHPLFRWFFGWLLPLDVTFMKWTTTKEIRKLTFLKQIFQDVTLPMTDLEESVALAEEVGDFANYEVWRRVWHWWRR